MINIAMNKVGVVAAVAAIVGVCGCADKGSDCILEVNDKKLTVDGYELRVRTRLAMAKIVTGDKKFEQEKEKIEKAVREGIGDAFIQESLMLCETERYFKDKQMDKGIHERTREDMLKKFSKNGELTFDKMLTKVGKEEGKCLEATLANEAKFETYLQMAYSNEITVSEAVIQKGLAKLTEYNSRVRATNDWMFALATNVWKKALSGADFAGLADKFSQEQDGEKKAGGDIGECSKVDFEDDDETWAQIAALKEGGITPPLKTFSGVEIFKLERKVPASESTSGEESYHLRKIVFRRGVEVQDYTPEEYKKELENTNRSRIMRKVLLDAWKRCSLSLPMGRKAVPVRMWSRMPGFPKDNERKEPMK